MSSRPGQVSVAQVSVARRHRSCARGSSGGLPADEVGMWMEPYEAMEEALLVLARPW